MLAKILDLPVCAALFYPPSWPVCKQAQRSISDYALVIKADGAFRVPTFVGAHRFYKCSLFSTFYGASSAVVRFPPRTSFLSTIPTLKTSKIPVSISPALSRENLCFRLFGGGDVASTTSVPAFFLGPKVTQLWNHCLQSPGQRQRVVARAQSACAGSPQRPGETHAAAAWFQNTLIHDCVRRGTESAVVARPILGADYAPRDVRGRYRGPGRRGETAGDRLNTYPEGPFVEVIRLSKGDGKRVRAAGR